MANSRKTVDRFAAALRTGDWEGIAEVLHPDYIGTFPQSGEIIRGRDNYVAVYANFPTDLPSGEIVETIGGAEQGVHVSSPMPFGMPIVTITGGGDTFTVRGTARYPNGDEYHVVTILELAAGQIIRETAYWAAPFEAPEWRSAWVEIAETY